MSATYDVTLLTDTDWVRFLSGDRDVSLTLAGVSRARLQDEEIAALLTEEANKYLAAARACEIILARSQGAVEKQVGDLKLKFSDNPQNAYRIHIQKLRERGAELTLSKPRAFRVL